MSLSELRLDGNQIKEGVLGFPGSAGAIDDEASDGLCDVNNATLRFKSGQTGTIVARYPVSRITVENPDFNNLISSYGYGPGVIMKLMRVSVRRLRQRTALVSTATSTTSR